jgi:hypothetical protein
MWIVNARVPIENQDPFKSCIEGVIGIVICFDGNTVSVTLKKDNFNKSRLVGDNLRIIMNTKRGGFEIFEKNLDSIFMSYEIFNSRIVFQTDKFLVKLGQLKHTNRLPNFI